MRCDVWWSTPVHPTPNLLALLDDTERTRYDNYRREADKLRFLTGRALIRGIAARELGQKPADITIDSSCFDCGKPHGKPKVTGLEISISHSGDRVALALTTASPVGIDVEEIRDASVDDLAGIAFSAIEREAFDAAPDKKTAFFTYWARKEAVVKATGKGMSVPMSTFVLTPHDQPPRVLASESADVDPKRIHMADLDAGDGYRAAVAVFGDEPLDITVTDAAALIASLG